MPFLRASSRTAQTVRDVANGQRLHKLPCVIHNFGRGPSLALGMPPRSPVDGLRSIVARLQRLRFSFQINHFQELDGSVFDIEITVMMCPTSHGSSAQRWIFLKSPNGNLYLAFVSSACVPSIPEMPLAIFSESVQANELVLLRPPSDDDLSTNFSYQPPHAPE